MTTVLESADDQCRMPVTCGKTPATSGVAGEESLASLFVTSVLLTSVSVAVSTIGIAVAAGFAIVTGGNACDIVTLDAPLAFTGCALRPSFHHTPAPRAAAINTSAATTATPGRECSSPVSAST